MSEISKARAELAAQILACPDGHTLFLSLFDGPTTIVAIPGEAKNVVVACSEKVGLHLSMSVELAVRLAQHLCWAATEVQIAAAHPVKDDK